MFVFSTSRKTGFKSLLDTSSIPCCLSSFFSFFLSQSRQLLDTWWIDQECFCLLDSFSTPGGLNENASASSIASWHLVDRSRFWSGIWWFVPRYLYLSMTIFSTPPDTFICWDLLVHYLSSLCNPELISLDLSLDTSLISLPNFLIYSNNCSSRFLQAFSSFSSLGKLLILSHSCISCFET